MFEKVNPSHPDKVADRIAGAIVDITYKKEENPHIAVEVLLGHGTATIIIESDVEIYPEEIAGVVKRITDDRIDTICYLPVQQDEHLNNNQKNGARCGDNGIFKGVPVSEEEQELANIAGEIYAEIPYDGKYIISKEGDKTNLIICQSHATKEFYKKWEDRKDVNVKINPLGDWTGGLDVDSGATNRKLGSDMGRAVSGGGLHGKDISKADVSVNIYCHLKAQELGKPYECYCAIGDDMVDGRPYAEIVEIAQNYINEIGGFEKFAEWGLIRPENLKKGDIDEN